MSVEVGISVLRPSYTACIVIRYLNYHGCKYNQVQQYFVAFTYLLCRQINAQSQHRMKKLKRSARMDDARGGMESDVHSLKHQGTLWMPFISIDHAVYSWVFGALSSDGYVADSVRIHLLGTCEVIDVPLMVLCFKSGTLSNFQFRRLSAASLCLTFTKLILIALST